MKKLLKSIVVAAVVGATLAFSSAVAFAATSTYYYVPGDNVNTDSYFTKTGNNGTTDNLEGSFVFNNDSDKYETSTSKNSVKATSGKGVSFNVVGTAEVEVVWSTRTNKTANTVLCIKETSTSINEASKASNSNYVHSTVSVESGTSTISLSSGNEGRIYGVKVVETIPDSYKTYKITGTCNLTSGTFNIGDYEATVASDGSFEVAKTAEKSPFAADDELAVSLDQYTASPLSVTLAATDDETVFSAGKITFTETELAAINAGEYGSSAIFEGKPNFDLNGLSLKDASNNYKIKGTVKLIASSPAVITVEGKNGSSSSGVTVTIGEDEEEFAKGDPVSFKANVPAGNVSIVIGGDSSGIQLPVITVEYPTTTIASTATTIGSTSDKYALGASSTYIIHAVTDAEMEKSSLALKGTSDNVASTNTVYEAVQFADGSTLKASDLGEDVKYIYAVKVTGTEGKAPEETSFTWVTE